MRKFRRLLCGLTAFSSLASAAGVTEFCLEGELDLGARFQGTHPQGGEFYPTSWCVVTEDDSQRVLFTGTGRSNPDMEGSWTVAYLPPESVRIVNRDAPPDVEFEGTDNPDEALRVRRIDPRRLLEELQATPALLEGITVVKRGTHLKSVAMSTELPLRGRVSVTWNWDWSDALRPGLRLMLEDALLFRATGRWRELPEDEAARVWIESGGVAPVEVPGEHWPARVNMQLIELAERVYVVGGVRTGFRHLVVDTDDGLVVADAPAGWVEFHHLPPSDLVPGLGVSGLSEAFIDFLNQKFPERKILAVALTHFHDDHAGGARAFAAAGAGIYSTIESAAFFSDALNREAMPRDRLSAMKKSAGVIPVSDPVMLGSEPNRVALLPMGANPHVDSMLGVWAIDKGLFFVSDVHVPRSDADAPRAERAKTECWFAGWAVRNLAPEVRVINSHSANETPVSRLANYLESDVCDRS